MILNRLVFGADLVCPQCHQALQERYVRKYLWCGQLRAQGIDLISPHRKGRAKVKTQDGRKLRRYRRRWKIERLNAWLQNYRRVATRYEYALANYVGFVHLACILILLRHF